MRPNTIHAAIDTTHLTSYEDRAGMTRAATGFTAF
jgi:hypothetical protein